MRGNEINFNNFGETLLSRIKNFKNYYYNNGYDDDDLKLQYVFITVLNGFIKDIYIDKEYDIKGNQLELDNIIKLISDIYEFGEIDIKELICIGFIEGLLPDNEKEYNKFIYLLKYDNLVNCANNLKKHYY